MFHALMGSMIFRKKRTRKKEERREREGEKRTQKHIWVTNVNDTFCVPTSFVGFIEFVKLNSIFWLKLLTRTGFLRIRPNCSSRMSKVAFFNGADCKTSEKKRKKSERTAGGRLGSRARMEFRENQMETANGPSEKSADYSPTRRVQCRLR